MSRRDVPDEEGVAVGWHLWLDDLEGHVSEARTIEASSRGRADELAGAYRKRLGEVLG